MTGVHGIAAMNPGDELPGPAGGMGARLEAEIPALRLYARRLAGGRDAEDLVQDVLARALRYRHAYDPGQALGPWLKRMALRVFLDERERASRAPAALEHPPEQLPGRARSEGETREEIDALLARLQPVERDVLLRFHRDGQSVREIARDLAMPVGTIKSHLHRARRALASRARPEELA